ncbi:MAG TPA: DUF1800 domain-containing protein [Vicinamibacterales bacterium]|nr:DUF1800 domain-containing protein [Vicinamibacterales bacterium]
MASIQEHVLRRMGFGASPGDLAYYGDLSPLALAQTLLNFDRVEDDVDANIGRPEYAGITTRGMFAPDTAINDARQRWIFRMVHSRRPLQEKMALFWHNHFATAYSKINGTFGSVHATKMMDAKSANFGGAFRGQVQLFRDMALGSFRDLLVEVARDPAMLVWLDGRTNIRTRPQENFGRELMELFTMGIGNYVEADVYAAARVFTGWNLELAGDRTNEVTSYYRFVYNAAQHDPTAKEFTFEIYPGGGRVIPARAAGQGMQDGLDLIEALARHPSTAARLATRLYQYFVNDVDAPDQALIRDAAQAYLAGNYSIKAMLQRMLLSEQFLNGANAFRHYSWPAEFAVRAIKETGWTGLSVDSAITPLLNMGQQLYEPPDVNGWALGAEWISTASMLARMNYASTLAANQKFNLARDAAPYSQTPDRALDYLLTRFSNAGFSGDGRAALVEYLQAGVTWNGSAPQLNAKIAGAAHLIVGAGEYQFN